MITVYGRKTSSNVQLVMWTIAELGLEYDRLDFGGEYGGTKTPEYMAMNPMSLVPSMRDGDVVMFESAAIHRYLCAQYGKAPFWPEDPGLRGPLDSWSEWVKTSFLPALLNGLFYPLVRMNPAEVTPEMITKGAEALRPLAAMLAHRLGEGPWMAGEQFTFADILCGHVMYRYFELPFERAELPELTAYYERLKARPMFREHVMISYEPLRYRPENTK